MKKANFNVKDINYRIKSFLDKGVTEDEIEKVLKDTEGFDMRYFTDGHIMGAREIKKAGLEVIDPKIFQGLAESLPNWTQLRKMSDYDDPEDILADFFAGNTVGEYLADFRKQYYDVMSAIQKNYHVSNAESFLRDTVKVKGGHSNDIIEKSKEWGIRYRDKDNLSDYSYQDAIKELRKISGYLDNVDEEIKAFLGKNKGVRV